MVQCGGGASSGCVRSVSRNLQLKRGDRQDSKSDGVWHPSRPVLLNRHLLRQQTISRCSFGLHVVW